MLVAPQDRLSVVSGMTGPAAPRDGTLVSLAREMDGELHPQVSGKISSVTLLMVALISL